MTNSPDTTADSERTPMSHADILAAELAIERANATGTPPSDEERCAYLKALLNRTAAPAKPRSL